MNGLARGFVVWMIGIASAGAASLEGADGRRIALESAPGAPTVLFFAAAGCGACGGVQQALEAGATPRRIGVVVGDDKTELRAAAKKAGLKFEPARADEALRRLCGFTSVPFVCVLDERGRLRERWHGAASGRMAVAMLAEPAIVPLREIGANPLAYAGRPVRLVGTLREGKGGTIAIGHYRLSNGIEVVGVRPWLPVKAKAKPGGGREPSMDDFVGKAVILAGQVFVSGTKPPVLHVGEATLLK